MRFSAPALFVSILAMGQGSTPFARLESLSNYVKTLAPMIAPATEQISGSREAFMESAMRFALNEGDEVEVFIQSLTSVRDGHLSANDINGAVWEVVSALYNNLPQVTSTTTTTPPPPTIAPTTPSPADNFETGKRSLEQGPLPPLKMDRNEVKKFHYSPTPEGELLRDRLRKYFDSPSVMTQTQTDGQRYLSYSHLKQAEKGLFDKLLRNLNLIESLGSQMIPVYFARVYTLLTTGFVELRADEVDYLQRIAARQDAYFARPASPAAIKNHLSRYFKDGSEISRPYGTFVAMEMDLYNKAVRGDKWPSIQHFLDFLEVMGGTERKIPPLFQRVYQYLQQHI
jgi:hypothetical protein